MSLNKTAPNAALQAWLRKRVEEVGLDRVSKDMEIGREQLARYLANIRLHTSTFRGIEATIEAAMVASEPLPKARASGLRR